VVPVVPLAARRPEVEHLATLRPPDVDGSVAHSISPIWATSHPIML
jgi:hypothetical protein